MHPGATLGSVCLFSVEDRDFTVDDAIAAAAFRGEIGPWIDEVHRLLASEERDTQPSDPSLEPRVVKASEAFRYAHDLITAEETEAWLRARGMTVQEFAAWFHLREAAETNDGAAYSDEFVERLPPLLRIHLWMTDAMEQLSEELRRRICAATVLDEESGNIVPPPSTSPHPARREELFLGIQRDPAWIEEMDRAETAYRTLQSRILTKESREKLLRSFPLAYTRVEISSLEVDSEGAAREFFLATQTEGIPLSELAAEMGFRIEHSELWLDGVEEPLRQKLNSAAEGQTLAPAVAGNGFRIVQVIRKMSPDLSDPELRRRVDRRLTDGYFSELTARLSRREIQPLSVASR